MSQIILVSESALFTKRFGTNLSDLGYSWIPFEQVELHEKGKNDYIVLVDIQSVPMTFRDLGTFLKEYPYPMLVLTPIPTFEEGYPLLRMGVKGYANLHFGTANLENALSVLESGGSWFDPGFMNDLIRRIEYSGTSEGTEGDLERLSEREQEIGRYVAQGLSNYQIAQTIEITERTVKAHLLSCYKKLGLNDRVSLALWFKKRDHA